MVNCYIYTHSTKLPYIAIKITMLEKRWPSDKANHIASCENILYNYCMDLDKQLIIILVIAKILDIKLLVTCS